MTQNRITFLLQRMLAQQATQAEQEEFYSLVQNASEEAALREALSANWLHFTTEEQLPLQQADVLYNNIINTAEGLHSQPAKLVQITKWSRMVAAAVIIILLGAGAYVYLNKKGNKTSNSNTAPVITDIKAPASMNAVLTLANGQQIELNKTAAGDIAVQGNASVVRQKDGQIVYNEAATTANAPLAYNMITVPRGSQVVNMVLADGSKVWLNAASSLRYPVSFTGNERMVEMTGEVYFEVAHNPQKPFIVTKGSMTVQVLGTHFNIHAYDDEDATKVTLLQGKVKVGIGNRQSAIGNEKSVVLKPGEQAIVSQASQLSQPIPVQTEDVVAWKNNRFEFGGNTIEPIMQQVARWYNVDIEYRGPKPTDNFMGGTTRQGNLSELLKILEQTKSVRFHIEDKKIIVSKP